LFGEASFATPEQPIPEFALLAIGKTPNLVFLMNEG
jgi:hypothetical protein